MDILKAEIERKRKLLEEKKLVVSIGLSINWQTLYQVIKHSMYLIQQSGNKKFFKRSDLLAREQEAHSEADGKQKESASTPEKSSDSRKLTTLTNQAIYLTSIA